MRTLLLPLLCLVFLAAAFRPDAPARAEGEGPAPELQDIEGWLNSEPLTLAGLRGKVVLLDFWTYSCINCVRTLPTIIAWHDAYKDKGLVVIGVHTPEFAFGRDIGNVRRAAERFGVTYPVAVDNRYATWRAYDVKYWPTSILIDRDGNIALRHVGESDYGEMEDAIRRLTAAGPALVAQRAGTDLSRIGTPEMFVGLLRVDALASPQAPQKDEQAYSAPDAMPENSFALVGRWRMETESAVLAQDDGAILLRFKAGKVHFVASSETPITLGVEVDGVAQPPVAVDESRLYTLFDSTDYGEHVLKLTVPKAGLKAFNFSFG